MILDAWSILFRAYMYETERSRMRILGLGKSS